jgi:uncharacterized protein (TIGR02246 family)
MFDSLRCMAMGRGKLEGNTETVHWTWARGQKSTRVTKKLGPDKISVTHRIVLPGGSIMDEALEVTRRKSVNEIANQTEDIATIKKLTEDWRSGWHTGDVDSLLSLYADDPILLPEGQSAVVGKDAIGPLYRSVLNEVDVKGQGKTMKVEVSGDLGYIWRNYTLSVTPKNGGEATEHEGKSVFVVKRHQDGAWKVVCLIDNSSPPPVGSE